MYTLRKTKRIEAAHHLPNHDGKCRGVHGHTWAITVEVQGERLNEEGAKQGMLVDYYDIGAVMKQFVEVLDHKDLNTVLANPTSENLARMLHDQMAPFIAAKDPGSRLSRVLVSETQDSVAEYAP